MRLVLIISSLRMGGAERVLALLANGLAGRGHAVTVLTFEPAEAKPFYTLDPRILVRNLDLAAPSRGVVDALQRNLRRIRVLKRACAEARPDTVLSFMDTTNILVLLAAGSRWPVVVSERVHPAHYDIGPVWGLLRKLAYPRAAALVVQTAEIAQHFPARLRQRIAVIPNPVPVPAAGGEAQFPIPRPAVAGMGRLDRQKGFDLLLRAFAPLARGHPSWTLAIFGEGPERSALEDLRNKLGLAGRVLLPGLVADASAQLRQADLFVLPSRFEGFPNALCEAMACGLPVIATNCPSGPRDIVRPGIDGLLVPAENVQALTAAMDQLMSDETLRRAFGAKAVEVLGRFGANAVLERWGALLAGLARQGR